MTNPTITRPVQQVNNPVKAPIWKTQSFPMRIDVINALDDFSEKHGFSKKETIDVALREYLNLPEPADV